VCASAEGLEVGAAPFAEQDVHRGTLRIPGVQEAHAGEYSCVAHSPAGSSSAMVVLEVGGERSNRLSVCLFGFRVPQSSRRLPYYLALRQIQNVSWYRSHSSIHSAINKLHRTKWTGDDISPIVFLRFIHCTFVNVLLYFIILLFITLLVIILLLCLCCWYFEQRLAQECPSGLIKFYVIISDLNTSEWWI